MDREEIVTAFRNVLDESKIGYKVDTTTRTGSIVISLGMKCDGGIGRVFALFEFKGTSFRIYGVAPNLDPAKDDSEMFRLLAMVNCDMPTGCFEFEMASRQIRFRHFIDCEGFSSIPRNFIFDTLFLPFLAFYRYGESFVALAEGFSDASIAFGTTRMVNGNSFWHPSSNANPPETKNLSMDKESIFTAVKQFLDKSHVKYITETTPTGYSLSSPAIRMENSLKSVSQLIEIGETHITIKAYCPFHVVPSQIGEIAKFLSLSNYDLLLGNFNFNEETGEVYYKHIVDCEGYAALPNEILCRFCLIPFLMLEQYGDALTSIATGTSDAATAFAQTKQSGK